MYPSESVHVRCAALVIHLAVKDCMGTLQKRMNKIRKLLKAIRASDKRRDIYESVKVEFNSRKDLTDLDVETRWSSTFTMLKSAHKAQRLLDAVVVLSKREPRKTKITLHPAIHCPKLLHISVP